MIIALSTLRDPETSDVSEDSKAGSFGFLVVVALLKVTLSNRRGPPKGKWQQTTCCVLNAREVQCSQITTQMVITKYTLQPCHVIYGGDSSVKLHPSCQLCDFDPFSSTGWNIASLLSAEHAELCKPFRTEMCDGQLGDAQSRQTSALSEARLENRFVTRSSTPPASAVSSCYSSSWVGSRLQGRTPGKVPGRPRPRRPHPPPGPLCAPRAEPRLRYSAAKCLRGPCFSFLSCQKNRRTRRGRGGVGGRLRLKEARRK